jgi:hypothetical protein
MSVFGEPGSTIVTHADLLFETSCSFSRCRFRRRPPLSAVQTGLAELALYSLTGRANSPFHAEPAPRSLLLGFSPQLDNIMNVLPRVTGPRVAGKNHADQTSSIEIVSPISSFGSSERRVTVGCGGCFTSPIVPHWSGPARWKGK